MPKMNKLWRAAPTREDLEGARGYLSLLCPEAVATQLAAALGRAVTTHATAKDLLRASLLPVLPRDESHVKADLKRIHRGKALAPVLLVRGDLAGGTPLVIADGYHRICAVWYFDEDASVACRLVSLKR
jgi:hypothetical protein